MANITSLVAKGPLVDVPEYFIFYYFFSGKSFLGGRGGGGVLKKFEMVTAFLFLQFPELQDFYENSFERIAKMKVLNRFLNELT